MLRKLVPDRLTLGPFAGERGTGLPVHWEGTYACCLLTRLYASTYPKQVSGMVLVDILSDSLRDAMTPEEWTIWKAANARRPQDIAEYPDLERIDFDVAMDQVKAAQRIRPIPPVALSADVPLGLVVPAGIDKGDLPPNTPRDFGYVIDRANKVAQAELAKLGRGDRRRRAFISTVPSCSQNPAGPRSAGACFFPIPAGLAAEPYESRRLANDNLGLLATSQHVRL